MFSTTRQDQASSPQLRLRPAVVIVVLCFLAAIGFAIWFAPAPSKRDPLITTVAFSPDGQFLAAGERQGGILVWRVESWQRAVSFRFAEGGLNTLTFSPDSRLLAIAGRSLQLWRTNIWKRAITLGASDGVYGTARFDTPGHLIASVNASERIEFWNAETGKLVRALCCVALYGDLAFSPNGRLLAAAGHWPRLWDLTTGRELRRLVKTRNPTFAAVSFRPDGRVLATGSQDGKTRLWEVATGLELTSGQTRQNYIESVAFHPRGQLLAYGVRDGAVWLWDTTTGTEQLLVAAATSNVAFSSDGRWLSFGGPGGTVHLWNVSEGREVPALAFPIN